MFSFILGVAVVVASVTGDSAQRNDSDYAIVVSAATAADPGWQKVVQQLETKHSGTVITFDSRVDEEKVISALRTQFPKYTCFVARPSEAGRKFVASVHQLTRTLDDDPYTDTRWAILTGFDASNALQIAKQSDPLVIKKVASGTEFATEMVQEGIWYCELNQNHMVRKQVGEVAEVLSGPADTTKPLVDTLNDYHADLFITSGHATERNWQIGFRYKNGTFRSKAGLLYGKDTQGTEFPVVSPNPKVYLPIGNCLMGHIDGGDAMALAWMHSAGVHQMIGYTVPTWFGYGGWGCLDYFVEQPGRYTFVEAFHANHHALVHCLETKTGNQRGLSFDRDVVALYGDPAWSATMAPMPTAYEQSLKIDGEMYELTIKGNRGASSFEPVNTNGAQRGWRPVVQFLPHRVKNVTVIEDSDLSAVVTDDFVLVPNPRKYEPTKSYVVKFKAERID